MAEGTERLIKGANEIAKFLLIATQRTLKEKGKDASGELIKTIEVVVREQVGSIIIQESHVFYGDFVDKGRKKGVKRVPIDALEDWIRAKKFSIAVDKIRGTAFAIQANIFKFGIKPTNWIDETVKRTDAKVVQMVEKAASENLEIIIDEIFKETDRRFKTAI